MKALRECPLWVKEEAFLWALLSGLIDKKDNRQNAAFFIRKNKLFAPMYDFQSGRHRELWKKLQLLAHEYQVIKLDPPKKRPDQFAEDYEGYKVCLNTEQEAMLRVWLDMPLFDPYRLTWQDALQRHKTAFEGGYHVLQDNPFQVPGRSAQEVIAALASVADAEGQALSVRELSARCFWGNSKFIEKRKTLFQQLYPSRYASLLTRPLLVEVSIPETFNSILFVENQDTFLRAVMDRNTVFSRVALVYSAGFRAANQKGRGESESVFAHVVSAASKSENSRFEAWWFGDPELQTLPVFFWGDLDFSGMQILASMKKQFQSLEAWRPGYEPMLNALQKGLGHTPEESDKQKQIDPELTGCQYADELILPVLRRQQRFMDQEWLVLP